MPTDQEFQKFYEDKLKPQINDHYKQKKSHFLRRWFWVFALFIILYFIIQIFFATLVAGVMADAVYGIVALLFLFFTYIVASSVNTEMNKKTMPDIFEETVRFLSKDEQTADILREKEFIDLSSLEENCIFKFNELEISGANLTNFNFNNEDLMTLSDLELFFWERGSNNEKIKKDVFNGVFFSLDFEKDIKKDIFLIPKFHMNKYVSIYGDEIHLENTELMHDYKIFCSDEIEARKILSLTIMDRVDEINKIFPHTKYFAFREDDKLVIFIENMNIKKILDRELPLFYSKKKVQKRILSLFQWFEKFMNLYNVLNLEENLKEKEAEKNINSMLDT